MPLAGPEGPTNSYLCGFLRPPGDDGLQGGIILTGGNAEVGVEGVIADRQGEVVSACFLVLLFPDTTTLDQLPARGAPKNPMRWRERVVAGDGFDVDVEVEAES